MSECRVIRGAFYLRVGTESEALKGYNKVKLFSEELPIFMNTSRPGDRLPDQRRVELSPPAGIVFDILYFQDYLHYTVTSF
jgi:hypothetical protein